MRLVAFLPDMQPELKSAFAGASDIDLVLTEDEDTFARQLPGAVAAALYSGSYNERLAESLGRSRDLVWVQAGSTGYDRLLHFGIPNGVRISTAGALWAGTVAEHALALILGLLRKLPLAEAQKANGHWDRENIRETVTVLERARVAIIGMGAIGQAIATRITAFGADIIAVVRDPDAVAPEVRQQAHTVTDLAGLLGQLDQVDIVVPAVPLNPTTERLIDAAFLARMGHGALLVNISRGGVVDETALIHALSQKRIGGAGLDVFEVEPLPSDSPLWSFDNVILTPHVGGFGDPRRLSTLARLIFENARRFSSGAPLLNEIKRPSPDPKPELLTEIRA